MKHNEKIIRQNIENDQSGQFPIFFKKLDIEEDLAIQDTQLPSYLKFIEVDDFQTNKSMRLIYMKFISKSLKK